MASAAQPAPRIEPHVWRIASVVILGVIMSVLDTTIVNVALHDLSGDLHAPLDSIQWVITGYLLSLAAVIPITGWAVRRYGARRLYLIALVVFTAGSALCGLAWSSGSLIAFRVLQGVGGGMLTPIGQMILVKAAGPRNLPKVMSAIGIPIVLAPVFGPTLGGLLLQDAGWQWIFMINVPVGILAFTLAMRLLPRDQAGAGAAGPLDYVGLVLAAAGTVGITYGLSESDAAGSLTSGRVLGPVLVGAALVTAFVIRSRRIDRPLLDVTLFANRAFSAASVVTFCLGGALFGAMILMPLYFQTVRGEDAINTGLLLIPQGLGAGIGMFLSGRATERLGAGVTSLIGGLVLTAATIPFVLIEAQTSYVLIGAAMAVRGIGIGLAIMPAMTAAFSVLTSEQVNDASPQLTVLQRVGGSLGTAIIAVVLQAKTTHAGIHASPAALAGSFGSTYWWVMGLTLVALAPTAVLAVIERRARGARELPLPASAPASELAPDAVYAEAAS
ncbi:MAG TPA: DHA2 family efflux MFS transporter permease subunit [Solirubrobacteraceae bacterium]|jgi:EmrB/QacA subfamily drug resistance transporter|nr:DHA2 family efflux MFS transporter permease subunit [Solirubrobacteraceae bacterium]